MKVFYSWQMDSPRKINKDFIHSALLDAIKKLGEEFDLSESERDRIEIDQDTQGVLGSPEISRVIFDKIAVSKVVVADVSLVARGANDKPHINSNVAIELGYAYGKVGDGVVLKVMNTHYGPPADLPFDLRIRRHPIQYDVPPNADRARIQLERDKLATTFASILRAYATSIAPAQSEEHIETPVVGRRGRFWDDRDVVVPKDTRWRENSDIYLTAKSVLYFRCIPLKALPPLTALEANDFARKLRPLLCYNGYSQTRNKWGVISYDRPRSGDSLIGAAQLFKNREIWGFDVTYSEVVRESDDNAAGAMRFVPTGAVQREYPIAINSFRQVANELDYGDRYTVEFGFSGAIGAHLAIDQNFFEPFPGPFYEGDVFIRKTISSSYHTMQLMNDFWDKLFSEVGRKVPSNLIWKPEIG